MQDITVQTLSDGLYLVENNNKKRFLIVMGEGIGQAFDMAGDPMVSGTGVLRALGITRVMKLTDKTLIIGDWFSRNEQTGSISKEKEALRVVSEEFEYESESEELDASEAFDKCLVRPDMEKVKRRDATDAALDTLFPGGGSDHDDQ